MFYFVLTLVLVCMLFVSAASDQASVNDNWTYVRYADAGLFCQRDMTVCLVGQEGVKGVACFISPFFGVGSTS